MNWHDRDVLDHQQERTVAAAMLTDVKLSGPGTTVGEVRALFADEHVHCAVIVTDRVVVAVVDRSDVDDTHADDEAAIAAGRLAGRVVTADADLQDAWKVMLRSGRRRLAVIDSDGMFAGLLCLKRTRQGFCSGRDVEARARTPRTEVLLRAGET